ncbi:hypothetical protein GE107_13395 [Cohnella sp. CFH 77786]|uniref:PrpR N-terminal domain-containing protein n=1 Tax=Cohnella sp. CFH 77786 TaxID=2662265 RepID=UPI001C6098F0|nr:PrpR N-terminal domain-containing protein [Cohnella sp. CFH 77786]MBW5447058.1 hypothetical protein [Cohnella sp. CFH 77786]
MNAIGGSETVMKVLVVAPYTGLGELIRQMTAQYRQFDITVVIADMKESLGLVESIGREGYDVIISRGGTARLLAQHSEVPVVEIQVSGFDVLRMLTLMKEYQAKIRLVGFPNVIQSFVSVSNLLDYDFQYTVIDDENEVGEALAAAKREGVQVIVGDTVTVRFAGELGMQGVLITSGRESVAEAFRTAELICRSLEKHKMLNRIYERLIRESGREAAVLDASLNVLFATQGIHSIWEGTPVHAASPNRVESGRFLAELLEGMASDIRENGPLHVYEPAQRQTLTASLLMDGEGSEYYWLSLAPSDERESGIRAVYPYRDLESFPSFLHLTGSMDRALRQAKQELESGRPVTLHGEQGTGKRIFAGALAMMLNKDNRLLELEARSGEEPAYRRLCRLIGKAKRDVLIHVRGLEKFTGAQQRKLADIIKGGGCRVVFSFEEHPGRLKGESRLDPKVLEWLGGEAIELLPLRERLDELEELVRAFLAVLNEKYGKQIVGLRPDVWELLRKKSWKGNLVELRDTIDVCVLEAQGEYIERTDAEAAANRLLRKAPYVADRMPAIDLNQSLEAIERDIIRYVLEEEDMNQSKAAKRLKINRTTLWRKVKGEE